MFNLIAASAAVALSFGGLATVPTLTIDPGEGVPLTMLSCPTDPQRAHNVLTVGGWATRTFTARGTDLSHEDPVRPRTIFLGEPCYGGGLLQVPGLIRELPLQVPFEGYDDWEDDPDSPLPGGDMCWYGSRTQIEANIETSLMGCVSSSTDAIRATAYHADLAQRTQTHFSGKIGSPVIAGQSWSASYFRDTLNTLSGGRADGTFQIRGRCIQTGTLTISPSIMATAEVAKTDATKSLTFSCAGLGTGYVPYIAYYWDWFAKDPDHNAGVIWRADEVGVGPSVIPTIEGYQSSVMMVGNIDAGLGDVGGLSTYIECRDTQTSAIEVYSGTAYYELNEGSEVAGNKFGLPNVDQGEGEPDETVILGVPDSEGRPTYGSWVEQINMMFNPAGWTATQCSRLVALHVAVCVWTAHEYDERGCVETEWRSDVWAAHRPYDPLEGTEGFLCEGTDAEYLEECKDVLYPPYVDPSSFEGVCGDPPDAAWLDFGWLPEVIQFYSECLFIPQGGIDRLDWIERAYDGSAMFEITAQLEEVAQSFSFSDSCGTLVDGEIGGAPFVVNTCAWSGYGAPIKGVLGVGISVLFGLWALTFVIDTLMSLPNRKSVNPLGGNS